MCNGFGGFYSKDGKVYFTTPDFNGNCSHSETAIKLPKGINERDLVPFECAEWMVKSFEWHHCHVPDWITNKDKRVVLRVMKLAKPHVEKYEKVRYAARDEYAKVKDAAWDEYAKVKDAARDEYAKVKDAARDEYAKVKDAARDEYAKVRYAAWDEYAKVLDAARDEYAKVLGAAWDEYAKVRYAALAEMIEGLKQIDGYLE